MLVQNTYTKEVSHEELFDVYLSLSFQASDLIRRAKISREYNDYTAYSWCKSDFNEVMKTLSMSIFAEWEDVRKIDRAEFPQFSFTEWLDRTTAKYAYDDTVYSDGSLISYGEDVPF